MLIRTIYYELKEEEEGEEEVFFFLKYSFILINSKKLVFVHQKSINKRRTKLFTEKAFTF